MNLARINQFVLLTLFVLLTRPSYSLELLTDEELAAQVGQSVFGISQQTSNNIQFTKISAQSVVELNANISKLQLGCGGFKGAGCDIDIDNLSLTGVSGGPNSSAKITNPFVEIAIVNANNKATRNLIGVRLGADAIEGLLTTGINNGTPNGLNSVSGHLEFNASSGTTSTKPTQLTDTITGRVNIGGCWIGCPARFATDNKPISIPSLPINFNTNAFALTGSRLEQAVMSASAPIPNILLTENSGTRVATMQNCFVVTLLPLCGYKIADMRMDGYISNLKVNFTINEDLGYVHRIVLGNSTSLSVQSSTLRWPNATVDAQKGWWLAMGGEKINLGSLDLASNYQVDIADTLPQAAQKISQYLYDNPLYIPFWDAVGSIFTSKLVAHLGNVDLSAATPLQLVVNNPVLGTPQNVTPNCWGSRTFC